MSIAVSSIESESTAARLGRVQAAREERHATTEAAVARTLARFAAEPEAFRAAGVDRGAVIWKACVAEARAGLREQGRATGNVPECVP